MRGANLRKLFDSSSISSSSHSNVLISNNLASNNSNRVFLSSNTVHNHSNTNKNFSSGSDNLSAMQNKRSSENTVHHLDRLLSTIKQSNLKTNKKRHITSTALKQSHYKEQEYTISLIENYAREVGISAFNFRTMEFFITQFIDNEAYVNTITMINYWSPLEIVMNQKSENSSLHLMIKGIFSNSYIGFLPRKNFNEDHGKGIYSRSLNKELSLEDVNTKYVCMASLSGLLNYLDINPNYIMTDNMVIKYHYLESHLNISFNSTLALELLINRKDNKTYSSLYSLFKCRTISGCRLLRSNILQPLAQEGEVNKRYDAVDELMHNSEMFEFIKVNIPLFKELEIYITKLAVKNEDANENVLKQLLVSIQGIRTCIKILPRFNEEMGKLKSELFVNISKFLSDKVFDELNECIDEMIEDFDFEQNIQINRKQDSIFFMIKEGTNNVLDVSRKTYLDTVNEIYSEFDNLKNQVNDPTMKLCYSDKKGYYISISEKYYNKNSFVVSQKIGKRYLCSNIALISFSERVKEIKSELINLSILNLKEVLKKLRKKINYLYVLSSHIALIDVLCSFADYAINTQTVRPNIKTSESFRFIYGKNCKHPTLNQFMEQYQNSGNNFIVPNDYFFMNNFNLLLLKGPNASGKTTYMKQLALLIILAQIGCFIPCDFFIFSIRKFIFTQFSANDSVEENRGSFIKQIIEMQKVITSNSSNALVLLDEPFDNSNSLDVLSIAMSFLDLLSTKLANSFIVISSHNNLVTHLSSFYFNAIIGTMVVEFGEGDINFLFKFRFNSLTDYGDKESEEEKNYGIILAEMIGFNKNIIECSKDIANKDNLKFANFESCLVKSKEANLLKMFIIRLFLFFFEIMASKVNYALEDEIKAKIIALYNFIKESVNDK